MASKLHVIMTGGTIDSVWSGAKDTVVVSEHSVLPGYFGELGRNLKFYDDIEFTEICMKDSRQIMDDDRKAFAACMQFLNPFWRSLVWISCPTAVSKWSTIHLH